MHKANLRKVGGSTMLAIPTAFLDQLHIKAGSTVSLEVNEGKLVIDPQTKRRSYTLDELLANYKPTEMTDEDRDWLNSVPVGNELI